MRYWIYWNTMVQGPFDVDELASLHAFSGELLVCMEDRQEWLPVNRVADLSAVLEQWRARQAPPLPPPPPPQGPPAPTPLQGELFGEAGGQQHLFESEEGPKGPYAFAPVLEREEGGPSGSVSVTMPFRFAAPQPGGYEVVEVLRTPEITFVPPRVVKESPLPEVEESDSPRPSPERDSAGEVGCPAEGRGLRVPLRLVPEEPQPVAPEPVDTVPVIPEPIVFEPPVLPEPVTPEPAAAQPLRRFALEKLAEEPVTETRSMQWVAWIFGIVLTIGLLGSLAYWLMDRYSSKSAIAEAKRLEPPVLPVSVPGVVPPAPVLKPTVPQPRALVAVKKPAKAAKPLKRTSEKAKPLVLPGVGAARPVASASSAPPAPPPARPAPDPWTGRQIEAVNWVMAKAIGTPRTTIGHHARMMLDQMHEKELLHAAQTGERLFLPDKISWSALREEGPRYRVYLNFMAWQVSGERIQTRSYQFLVNLGTKEIATDDSATQQDFLAGATTGHFKHDPMADGIEEILSAVDLFNKHKMRSMIVKDTRQNKDEQKNIQTALAAARAKVQRSIVYFRTKYPEKALQNIAKAYNFTELLKV